jgi:predicted GIY-YIG superfamily endonuclease
VLYFNFNAANPGLYEIFCKANSKKYIGEASNVIDRIAQHSQNLLTGIADCPALQLN